MQPLDVEEIDPSLGDDVELIGVIGFIRFDATFSEPLALDPDPKVGSS
jgi:hypothetical protein